MSRPSTMWENQVREDKVWTDVRGVPIGRQKIIQGDSPWRKHQGRMVMIIMILIPTCMYPNSNIVIQYMCSVYFFVHYTIREVSHDLLCFARL